MDLDVQPVRGEVEVADDLRAQEGQRVGARRSAHTGPQLLRHARTPDDVAALEDLDLESGPRQVRGSDEAVVAGADDDRVQHGAGHYPQYPQASRVGYSGHEHAPLHVGCLMRWHEGQDSTR